MYQKKSAVSVMSAALIGVEANLIEVECDQRPGITKTYIVGLADKAVVEAKQRIKSAIRNSGGKLAACQVVLNLAPADLPKAGSGFDLALAIAMMMRRGDFQVDAADGYLLLGELALDGSLRTVKGVLAAVQLAKTLNIAKVVIPFDNRQEAALIQGVEIYPAKNLREVIGHLRGGKSILVYKGDQELVDGLSGEKLPRITKNIQQSNFPVDFSDIKGHSFAKRALEIVAAGGHNLFMKGPPGSGKTMLAQALISIMPPMSVKEMVEVTKIHSAAGRLSAQEPYIWQRPWRNPHHSASAVALVGGGGSPKPGEISLAHRGILFLDEFPEFSRHVLENLRQPLENGYITVSRAQQSLDFPARFLLVAAMNPCPCGFLNDSKQECRCLPSAIQRYQNKLSGPLLDRFDLFLQVPRLEWQELSVNGSFEESFQVSERVKKARQKQAGRFKQTGAMINQELSSRAIKRYVQPNAEAMQLLQMAAEQQFFSNRAYFRVLRVARTIADLAGETQVKVGHVSEALQYRP